MPVPVEAALNHLVAFGRPIPASAAQRVVFRAHVLHMGRTEGGLLVQDRFFATPTGPAVRRATDLLVRFRDGTMRDPLRVGSIAGCSRAERAAVEEAWTALKGLTPEELARATTGPGTAWSRAYERGREMPISDRHVFEEFMALHDA